MSKIITIILNKKIKIENFVSDNHLRSAMARVCLDGDKLIATDGHKLIKVNVRIKDGQVPIKRILILPEVFTEARRAAKRNNYEITLNSDYSCSYIYKDIHLRVSIDKAWVYDGLVAVYPDYNKVMPKHTSPKTINLNLKMLVDILKDTGVQNVALTFGRPQQPIEILSLEENGVYLLQMPARGKE
jgi:DNA polymerase III sliding clamp (beta) subunit (PCNA family)